MPAEAYLLEISPKEYDLYEAKVVIDSLKPIDEQVKLHALEFARGLMSEPIIEKGNNAAENVIVRHNSNIVAKQQRQGRPASAGLPTLGKR